MKIQSSNIGMESARTYQLTKTTSKQYVFKQSFASVANGMGNALGDEALEEETMKKDGSLEESKGEVTGENQTTAEEALKELQDRMSVSPRREIPRATASDTMDRFRQMTTRYIMILLFGSDKAKEWMKNMEEELLQGGNTLTFSAPVQTLYFKEEGSIVETESVSFSSTGNVVTEDGREISFHVNVNMSREFVSYYSKEWTEIVPTCDPLVINFDGDVAELSDQNFYFDIDMDGQKDIVSYLEEGSGYLSLDQNGDGKINDGSELFGPKSGNGFADLAAYDQDKNGWIDENDAIWSKLRIWCKTANGGEELYTLSEKGVGALCLQKTSTEFALKEESNATNGYIRSTGIFLYENGNVGTLQHVDLVKK